MTEKEKTAYADELAGNRINSSSEHPYYTGDNTEFHNLVLRAMAKGVELLESIHGEIHLMREAEEKQAEQMKRLADVAERTAGDNLVKNELLSDISRNTEGAYRCTSVCQAMAIRISNGLQAIFPKFKDSFKV